MANVEPVPVIGIDLGTTNSVVGIFKNGRVQILANSEGSRLTPSCVSYTKDKILVGEPANKQLILNPTNTIYDMKRLIGKCLADDTVEKNKMYWAFNVKEEDDNPVVEIDADGGKRLIKPEEVSALILKKMKETAERVIQKTVTKAVITVPAYFNQAQKQGTIRAAQLAGLEVVSLVTEPAAAAFAYGFDNNDYTNTNILVEDIGGGTFDVVVVKVNNGRFVVSAIGGDTQLGGRDFDYILMDYFAKKIKDKYNKDCFADKRKKQRLLKECVDVKHALTSSQEASLNLSELFPDIDDHINITRDEFNKLCEPLFQKIQTITQATLNDARLNPIDINEILLVGGSSRIPRIEELLTKMFPEKKMNKVIHSDEAVAYGAALCAQKYFESDSIEVQEKLAKMELVEAIPLGLGTDLVGGVIDFLIPRNSNVPVEKTYVYSSAYNDQKVFEIKIYESAGPLVKDANYLGTFSINGIKPGAAGSQQHSLTYKLDKNGMLSVSAKYEDRVVEHHLDYKILRATKNKVEEMLHKYNENQDRDDTEAMRIAIREDLKIKINQALYELNSNVIAPAKKQNIKSKCDLLLSWIENNKGASEKELTEKLQTFNTFCFVNFNHT